MTAVFRNLLLGWLAATSAQCFAEQDPPAPQAPPIQQVAPAVPTFEDLQRLLADHKSWRSALALAETLHPQDPRRVWELIAARWNALSTDGDKLMFLNTTTNSTYPLSHWLLHLGMTDRSLKVQNRAIAHVRRSALFDPALDFAAYINWFNAARDKSASQIVAEGFRGWLNSLQQATRRSDMREMKRLVEFAETIRIDRSLKRYPATAALAGDETWRELLVEVMRQSDVFMQQIVDSPSNDALPRDTIRAAGRLLRTLPLSDAFLQQKIIPLTDSTNHYVRHEAIRLLAVSRREFAFRHLVEILNRSGRSGTLDPQIDHLATAVAEFGDARVIPIMIGLIKADDSPKTIYGVGYFGLGPLTQVQYDRSHDGQWWRNWWEKNRQRFSVEVQSIAIPNFPKTSSLPPDQPDANHDKSPR